MYGIILEAAKQYILDTYGENTWIWLCKKSNFSELDIQTRKIYQDNLMIIFVTVLSDAIFIDKDTILFDIGRYTIQYLIKNGFENFIRVLGKTFKDLLLSLNDHHEYLRYSYHRIKPPTFIILSSTSSCIMLEYTTRRPGYNHYVRGLLFEVAKYFYHLHLIMRINSEKREGPVYRTVFALELCIGQSFLERELCIIKTGLGTMNMFPKISKKIFFELTPFHLLFDTNLMIHSAGQRLLEFQPILIGSVFQEYFTIILPIIKPSFDRIKIFSSCTFKIALKMNKKKLNGNHNYILYLKGQIIYVKEWSMLLFIGKPNFSAIKSFIDFGLYLHDISMYDRMAEKMVSGDKVSEELLQLLEKQKRKSKELARTARKLDEQRRKTYELLEQCLPKEVAKQISQGKSPLETMKAYDSVTICFTKVANFSNYCSRMCPHKIVEILNQMYTLYDSMTESHNVYKVETVNDSYMLVSGAPSPSPLHSAHIIEMALDILKVTKENLFWPNEAFSDNSTGIQCEQNVPLQLFIGCHTGSIVAGIVGFKTPRYCLFGDTVNTANRMMSTGLPDAIHISSDLANELSNYPYVLEYRGEQIIKGKGKMTTYFVRSRNEYFTMIDTTTGEVLDFRKLLREDVDKHCKLMNELDDLNSVLHTDHHESESSSSTISDNETDIEEFHGTQEVRESNLNIINNNTIRNYVSPQSYLNKYIQSQKERELQFRELNPEETKQRLSDFKPLEKTINPLTLGLTEIGIVQPENPLQYLGSWLCEFAKTSTNDDLL
ncbi:Soluble guanylate cyclase 88E [Schistosoma japonicum]|nr:Soluble guanylate cyclase 88E [Schistosoma japonicum]